MESSDPLENKFKSAFTDYKVDPPESVWENLSRELHPEPEHASFRTRIAAITNFHDRRIAVYLTLATGVVLLFLIAVYFGSADQHAIRGHAYTGEGRLCRGTAVLFRVSDKAMPWDSVSQYRTARIDDKGNYQFNKVDEGKYLLRISPDMNSEASVRFLPSWYDQHGDQDSSHLIIIRKQDVNADVHLIEKSEKYK